MHLWWRKREPRSIPPGPSDGVGGRTVPCPKRITSGSQPGDLRRTQTPNACIPTQTDPRGKHLCSHALAGPSAAARLVSIDAETASCRRGGGRTRLMKDVIGILVGGWHAYPVLCRSAMATRQSSNYRPLADLAPTSKRPTVRPEPVSFVTSQQTARAPIRGSRSPTRSGNLLCNGRDLQQCDGVLARAVLRCRHWDSVHRALAGVGDPG